MSLSDNRSLCLTHNKRITLAGPAVFAPVFVYEKVCAHECSRITQICQQSSLLNLKHTHTHSVVAHELGLYIIMSSLSSPTLTTLYSYSPSLIYAFIFQSSSMSFTFPLFFSSPLANLIGFAFLLSFPMLSSFSHAPVGEYNEMAMAGL